MSHHHSREDTTMLLIDRPNMRMRVGARATGGVVRVQVDVPLSCSYRPDEEEVRAAVKAQIAKMWADEGAQSPHPGLSVHDPDIRLSVDPSHPARPQAAALSGEPWPDGEDERCEVRASAVITVKLAGAAASEDDIRQFARGSLARAWASGSSSSD